MVVPAPSISLSIYACSYLFLLPPFIHLITIVLVPSVQYLRPLLTVRLKSSKRLAVILSLAHFTATGLLWPLALPVMVKFAGSILLAISLLLYLRGHAWLASPQSIVRFDLSDDMICTLETRQRKRVACALLGSSFVAPYLTVLELKPLEPLPARKRIFSSRSVVILPDNIDPEEFRELRVLLRWKWKDQKGLD